ncbi:Cohesin subunit sa-3 [Thalictrum thalictroides]|uniref:Cohesin subunit SA-3 n=1 Tax=Thalictrum thalictroides TaxID=46969 RepID=A0A7J6UTU8_THATH|nr:Cohesin subunit sa-3 [Thalictrum thalictroides]
MENTTAQGETSNLRKRSSRVQARTEAAKASKGVTEGTSTVDNPDLTSGGSSDPSFDDAEQGGSGDGSFDDFDIIGPRRKRPKTSTETALTHSNDLSLIEVVKSNGKLISHVVKVWVEQYEKNPKPAMVELLMMLFEACGAKYCLNEDFLDETDVDDVVVALVELARKGEVEDYHSSKRKELKNFKENLVLFWDNMVIECQNGPLFDKILFEKCMDYIVALSCSPPRVYRQVASLVGLQLVASFITISNTLGAQRETTQRQLNAEKKKNNEGPRVESLNKRLSMTHEKITVMEDMMRKLFTGLFVHRYRDIDPEIRTTCINSLGVWILSYPSLFLQDLYLKYLGWTLNDKNAGVRKSSILALQSLYEVDDNVASLTLFTERFLNRMIELADDIDTSVAVCAIGLIKQLLRHKLLSDDDLGPLYDLLIVEATEIRRAIGALVYDNLIAQKYSQGGDKDSPENHLGKMLQILSEFSTDPILCIYVIDDVWEYMNAMKDWKCIISMLLDENHATVELTDMDATNLIRLLHASVMKAVGERIVPATDNRKQYLNKAQKEILEVNRRDITLAMMKSYPQLLRKFLADRDKVQSLVEIIIHLKLELYSLKRQEQNFRTVLQLIKEAFFKHGDKDSIRSCIKALVFCSSNSQGELQDFAQNKLKELEDDLLAKLKSAMEEVAGGDDEYSLLVNLKRLYELQLQKSVPLESFYENFVRILVGRRDMDSEVVIFLLLNMYLHVTWSLSTINDESFSELSLSSLLSKRNALFEQLEYFLDNPPEVPEDGRSLLASRVCVILSESWVLFRDSKYSATKFARLGFCPDTPTLMKFWKLCEKQLQVSDETEDEAADDEYIEETNRVAVMIGAAKLVVSDVVPKDYLGPEIISHFAMHGPSIAEFIKYLITALKKTSNDVVSDMFLEALKRAYQRHVVERSDNDDDFILAYQRHVVERSDNDDESTGSKSFLSCKDLAARLSGTFSGAARHKYRSDILKIVRDGVSFAFVDAPRNLPFLEGVVLEFVSKLPTSDILDILKEVQKRTENENTDEDPSGWRPYYTFVNHLREKYAKNDGFQDESARRRGRPLNQRNLQGRKLFEEQSSSEESISASDHEGQEDEEDDEEVPLMSLRSSSKLRSLRFQRQHSRDQARSGNSGRASHDDLTTSRMSGASDE